MRCELEHHREVGMLKRLKTVFTSRLFQCFAALCVAFVVFAYVSTFRATKVVLLVASDRPAHVSVKLPGNGTEGTSRHTLRIWPGIRKYEIFSNKLAGKGRVLITVSAEQSTKVVLREVSIAEKGNRTPAVTNFKGLSDGVKTEGADFRLTEEGLDWEQSQGKSRVSFTFRRGERLSKWGVVSDSFSDIAGMLPLLSGMIIAGAVALLGWKCSSWRSKASRVWLATAASVAAVCCLAMAASSRQSSHPDEFWHYTAAGYFMTDLRPPALGSWEILGSYSSYGHSYLQSFEPAYILAGRLMGAFTEGLPGWLELPMVARLFQCLCFVLMLAWLLIRGARVFPLLVLSYAQVWYIFSYFNGDAFSFAIGAILAYEIVGRRSMSLTYFQGNMLPLVTKVVLIGLGLALLIAGKKNYWVLAGFIIIGGVWQMIERRKAILLKPVITWLAIGAVAGGGLALHHSVEAGRPESAGERPAHSMDTVPHSLPTSGLTTVSRDRIAIPSKVYLRSKGEEIWDLFWTREWAWLSWSSFVGVFGLMDVKATDWFYAVVGCASLFLLVVLATRVLRRGASLADFGLAICGLGLCFGNGMLSLWWSWTVDFQPQGRYLFPALIIVGSLWERFRKPREDRDLESLSRWHFACALLVFVLVGLRLVDGPLN